MRRSRGTSTTTYRARARIVDDARSRPHRRASARRSRGRRPTAPARPTDGCAAASRRATRRRAAPARCARRRGRRPAPCAAPVLVEAAHEADLASAGQSDRRADGRGSRRGEPRAVLRPRSLPRVPRGCAGSATSRLERFFLRGREEHVVQDQPVARRVRVQRRGRWADCRSRAADLRDRDRRGRSNCPSRSRRGCTSPTARRLLGQRSPSRPA